jgi:hypothetical protein
MASEVGAAVPSRPELHRALSIPRPAATEADSVGLSRIRQWIASSLPCTRLCRARRLVHVLRRQRAPAVSGRGSTRSTHAATSRFRTRPSEPAAILETFPAPDLNVTQPVPGRATAGATRSGTPAASTARYTFARNAKFSLIRRGDRTKLDTFARHGWRKVLCQGVREPTPSD